MEIKFDPFNDRLARDIRNGLSSALAHSLAGPDTIQEVSRLFLGDPRLLPHHRAYIDERLRRYQVVRQTVRKHELDGIVCAALVMWDEKLFFEVHECLEGEWYPAPAGPRKLALQALICAAGTFVHLEQGNQAGAAKMAARARSGLTEFCQALPELGDALPLLIAALEDPTEPPRLFTKTQCCQNASPTIL